MKKIICLITAIVMCLLSTQVFAATYYDINIEGLTSAEKKEVVEWLEDEGFNYDVESYTSTSSSSQTKVIIVDKLSNSEKNALTSWLESKLYPYSYKTKNGYYYVTIEYKSSNKTTLTNYLKSRNYDYDNASNNTSSSRSGTAYLVANGYLWYADGDQIQRIDTVYSPEYVLFTDEGSIAYINKSKEGYHIEDVRNPEDKDRLATSVKNITTNSSGYATAFKGTGSRTTKIEVEDDNEKVTMYVVKGLTLYSLSNKNKLNTIKVLSNVTTSYSSSNTNIGFSEWGDLVFITSAGVVWFNEKIDKTNKVEILKDQYGYSVKGKYLTVGSDGIIKNLVLSDGSIVKLEDE